MEAVKGGVTGGCWEEMEADVETLKGERRFLKIKYFVFIARGFYFCVQCFSYFKLHILSLTFVSTLNAALV